MVIYKTTNKLKGKCYIGKDKYNNPTYLGSGKILKQAIKKHGKEFFIKEIIEETDDSSRECYWIQTFNTHIPNGYNIAPGGIGGDIFNSLNEKDKLSKRCKHSKTAKERIKQGIGITSKSIKGMHITDIYPEIKDKWNKNHKEAMDNVKKRHAAGILTEDEKGARIKIKQFCRSPAERLNRPARASGTNNSRYNGPYIVKTHSGKTVRGFLFIKDIKEYLGICNGTIIRMIRTNDPYQRRPFKGWTIHKK